MLNGPDHADKKQSPFEWIVSNVGRVLISLFVPLVTFLILWQGFIFLRESQAPKIVISMVAIVWGVGGAGMLYVVANWLVEKLPDLWKKRLVPFVFVGPAIAILFWFLLLPTIRTLYLSFFNNNSTQFVGLKNYIAIFTERNMFESYRNNLLWILFGTAGSVGFGLLIAVLADRSSFENYAKSLIFPADGHFFCRRWRYLEIYLLLSARKPGANRLVKCDCYRSWRSASSLDNASPAME